MHFIDHNVYQIEVFLNFYSELIVFFRSLGDRELHAELDPTDAKDMKRLDALIETNKFTIWGMFSDNHENVHIPIVKEVLSLSEEQEGKIQLFFVTKKL